MTDVKRYDIEPGVLVAMTKHGEFLLRDEVVAMVREVAKDEDVVTLGEAVQEILRRLGEKS